MLIITTVSCYTVINKCRLPPTFIFSQKTMINASCGGICTSSRIGIQGSLTSKPYCVIFWSHIMSNFSLFLSPMFAVRCELFATSVKVCACWV